MATYETTVSSTWDAATAFDYLADFSHAQEWDPGVQRATRLDDGPVGLGSRFELVAEFNGRSIPLVYEVTTFEPPHRVGFLARTSLVESDDVISLSPTATGVDVTYRAILRPRGWLRLATPLVNRSFGAIGDRARDSLRRRLNS